MTKAVAIFVLTVLCCILVINAQNADLKAEGDALRERFLKYEDNGKFILKGATQEDISDLKAFLKKVRDARGGLQG